MRRLAIVGLAVAVLAGCAPAHEGREEPRLNGASAEQLAALDDGEVTEEEYTAGYRRLLACVAEAGYVIDEYGRPSTVYEFGIEEAAVDSGAFDECYEREFKGIDVAWQTANPPWTDAGPVLQECLAEAGLSTEGNEEELKQRMIEHGLDVWECLGLGIPED